MWLAILSSSVISGVLSACILGYYNLRAKQHEYINDYYKTVIARRIAAYEQLENLIVNLKTCVLDTDNKPYHLLFSQDDDWKSAYHLLMNAMSHALWLSEGAFEKIRDLNYLIFNPRCDKSGVIKFGKTNYESIAELRAELERILALDMLELHNVEKFLKNKKDNESGFHQVQIGTKLKIIN